MRQSVATCRCKVLPSSASAITLPPPLKKPALRLYTLKVLARESNQLDNFDRQLKFLDILTPYITKKFLGRSYPYILLVAYYLYYTSILSTCLGTLAV